MPTRKSFLLLFFKKEDLPYLRRCGNRAAAGKTPNPVEFLRTGQPMRDQEHAAPFGGTVQRGEEGALGVRVEAGAGFVQD
jgi:hypothetical protein